MDIKLQNLVDTVLNIDDENFAVKLNDAIGVKSGDTIEIITPQFDRTDGVDITSKPIPNTVRNFDTLKLLPKEILVEMGLGVWDETSTTTHYLYPKEWYDSIPDGYPVTFISGDTEPFKTGKTDDDYRYGCLAYGFVVNHE